MSNKLFVRNLPWAVKGDDLEKIFTDAGYNVQSATVITDRDSGRSKGFGFVELDSEDAAQDAVNKVSGKEIEGREISVQIALPREDKPRRDYR